MPLLFTYRLKSYIYILDILNRFGKFIDLDFIYNNNPACTKFLETLSLSSLKLFLEMHIGNKETNSKNVTSTKI